VSKKKLKRLAVLMAGVGSILIGLIGFVVPILQGWFFLAIGVILLSIWSPRIREYMDRHTLRYPRLHKVIKDIEGWVIGKIGDV
jgi:uncharacterized protein